MSGPADGVDEDNDGSSGEAAVKAAVRSRTS